MSIQCTDLNQNGDTGAYPSPQHHRESIKMAKVNAAEYAEKWGRRLKGATEDMRRGVERVSVAPGQAAADNLEKMKQNLMRSLEDGTWEKAMRGVSLEDWKDSMIKKGVGRVAAGVDGALPKQVAMAEKLLSDIDSVNAEVHRMPKVTLDDSINRMVAFSRGMSERSKKR